MTVMCTESKWCRTTRWTTSLASTAGGPTATGTTSGNRTLRASESITSSPPPSHQSLLLSHFHLFHHLNVFENTDQHRRHCTILHRTMPSLRALSVTAGPDDPTNTADTTAPYCTILHHTMTSPQAQMIPPKMMLWRHRWGCGRLLL